MRPLDVSRAILSLAVPLVMFPLIYLLQVNLSHEVGVFPLYMIPVAMLAWEFGWRGASVGVVLAMSLWLIASIENQQPFSSELLRYYNAGIRGFVFIGAAVTMVLFRNMVAQHRRRMEAMRALLNVCHGCGSVQGSDGEWIPFEQLGLKSHRQSCECPTCAAAQGSRKRL
jgi:glucose-6-phosphate-specific signal transduction histidine kinase